MARLFITGSSDGLGQMAAQLLIEQGHNVVLSSPAGYPPKWVAGELRTS
jgi:short-subunit dehydrogenase